MCRVVWVLAVLVHAQLSRAAFAGDSSDPLSESVACDDVASLGTSETQASLLQRARQTVSRQQMEQKQKQSLQLAIDDVFLYDHLPKAGGSFIRGVLAGPDSKVLPPENVRIIEEAGKLSEELSEEDRQHTFTVGSIRNPCDYYVSCWAFSGRLKNPELRERTLGLAPRNGVEFFGTSEDLNTTEDQQRFGKWLRHMMPDGPGVAPGLLTSRLLWSYAWPSVANATVPEPTLQGLNGRNEAFTEQDRQVYYAAATSFDPSSVDCWIHTEKLTEDLRRCLMLFEERAGSGVVNWKEFDELVARRELEHEETSMEIWTKNSKHQPCQFYFDKANADFVLQADFAVFSKFDYPTCC